jgi:adenosylcobinamide hydrolase
MHTFSVGRYQEQGREHPLLVWRLDPPMLAIASTPLGGGVGVRRWIVNAEVALGYERTDLQEHLGSIARTLGCEGPAVGFLTAAPVEQFTTGRDNGVDAYATVGLRHPTWAAGAAEDSVRAPLAGTINLVVLLPVPLALAALVNAVITATEAKTQALLEHGVPATGTASDAICITCPIHGHPEPFAGPRAPVGSSIARAVHTAVSAGTAAGWPPGEALQP